MHPEICYSILNFPRMPKFKKEVYKIMSYMLEEKEIKPFREIFRQLDEFSQGIINYKTLHSMFLRNGYNIDMN